MTGSLENLNDIETFCPASQQEWRRWLKSNHKSKQSIWLFLYKKGSDKPVIGWGDAVNEALCFGWVDSTRRPFDDEKFLQFFSKRKPKGTWSKVNKLKVKQLIENGLMTKAGLDCIEAAKKNGSWIILDEVEELKIPKDLAKEFRGNYGSREFFLSLSKSVRKSILQWVVLAKRSETRQKRISEIAELAAQKQKPKQFR
ncbi:MAG TPA: YdeI/OmpD-associated family protein [Chryseolinea sp.]|nr:YdeI/OmpD-associated family protein [Chryseolinea sp.]